MIWGFEKGGLFPKYDLVSIRVICFQGIVDFYYAHLKKFQALIFDFMLHFQFFVFQAWGFEKVHFNTRAYRTWAFEKVEPAI